MPATLKTGSVFIKEGTLFPDSLRFESEPCAPGWRLVKNLDGHGLDQEIHQAGWTFFHMGCEINVTVFGFDEQKTVRRAVEQILANLKSETFNSLEITRVDSVASKRFLGVTYLTVCAHSRHIKAGPIPLCGTEAGVKPLRAVRTGLIRLSFPRRASHETLEQSGPLSLADAAFSSLESRAGSL